MKHRILKLRLAALALVALTLTGFAAVAADQGTAADPLVSLSYLTSVFKPSVLSDVDAKVAAQEARIKTDFSALLAAHKQEVEQLVSGLSGGVSITGQSTATYAVATLSSGQVITGTVGTEFMLRVGTAVCSASSAPGLINVTTGGSINNGAALTTNHLYMATIDPRGVKATSGTVKLLVRGTYTIK